MTTQAAPRVAGKRGKRPARRVDLKSLHEYLTSPLPPPAYPVDVRAGVPDDGWGMLGNGPDPTCTLAPDGVGDCTFAGRQHYRLAKAAGYGETETWEISDALVREYLAYDHGQDEGAVISDLLLTWYKAGKILAFAPVDHASPAAVDAAMAAFRGVYAGVDLTDDADDLFSAGQPWTVANGEQPDPSEGHCIVKVYADDPRSGDSAEDGWVTWGAVQRSTKAWTSACLTEAWVVVTTEDEAAKLDMPALLADIEALGGTGGHPKPVPTPAPKGGTGMLEALEAKLAQIWGDVSGEARQELQQLLADAKAEEAQLKEQMAPLVTELEGDLKQAVTALEPAVQQAVEAILAKFLASVLPLLGKAPASE